MAETAESDNKIVVKEQFERPLTNCHKFVIKYLGNLFLRQIEHNVAKNF